MLAIRLQRTGRKGHAQFRVVVQDSRITPTSGRVVAQLGHYNPHSKDVQLDKEAAQKYLDNGAQPSDRVVLLFKKEGVKLPKWVKVPAPKQRTVRNPEKLQKESAAESTPTEEAPVEAPDQVEPAEASAEDTPAEESPAEPEATEEAVAPAASE